MRSISSEILKKEKHKETFVGEIYERSKWIAGGRRDESGVRNWAARSLYASIGELKGWFLLNLVERARDPSRLRSN